MKVTQEISQFFIAHGSSFAIQHKSASVQYNQSVTHSMYMVNVVFDINTRPTIFFNRPNEVQNFFDLGKRESDRWFIQHDQVALEMHGATDCNTLSFTTRQPSNWGVYIYACSTKVLSDKV